MARRAQRGFTLIELMVVLAIVVVLTLTLATMSATGGEASPRAGAEQVTEFLQIARLRAEGNRQRHRVEIKNSTIEIQEAVDAAVKPVLGFANPIGYRVVQSMTVPGGVVIWNADLTVANSAGGANPAQNAALTANIDFKPDGSVELPTAGATGATIYITDPQQMSKYRIFIFKVTGNSMARENW